MGRRAYNGLADLAKAAVHRRRDARRLYDPGTSRTPNVDFLHLQGCVYLAGYVLECKLKCLAMEMHKCVTLDQLIVKLNLDQRDVYTHGLEVLGAHVPALWDRFRRYGPWREFTQWANRWRPSWRYSPRSMSEHDTNRFLRAIDLVNAWFDTNRG